MRVHAQVSCECYWVDRQRYMDLQNLIAEKYMDLQNLITERYMDLQNLIAERYMDFQNLIAHLDPMTMATAPHPPVKQGSPAWREAVA